MIPLDSAQIWTIIGVASATMIGGMTLLITLMLRLMDSRLGGIEGRLEAKIDGLRNEMTVRLDAMNTRIDRLDSDMSSVVGELFRRKQE